MNLHAMRRLTHAGIIVLGCQPGSAAAQEPGATVAGRVLDAQTRAPIAGAEVRIGDQDVELRAVTDTSGRFSLDGVPVGPSRVEARRPGYLPARTVLEVSASASAAVELAMERAVYLVEEVTVTPGAFDFMDAGSGRGHGLSREEIEAVPQLGEDILRAVNRLPGLSSGDYAAHFSIRGGRHDETLILLDGLELYEPYHLKDFDEGAISIVDAQTIEGVTLLTGGFPARYGNRRSGVLDIRSRIPEPDGARYEAGLSFMNARAMGRGPLAEGRGSWLVSARSGYMDLVFGLINQNDLPSPRYHDVFGRLQRTLGARHVVSFDVLHARDRYTFDAPATTGLADSLRTRETARNTYGNSYVWTSLDSRLGRFTHRTQLSAGLVTRSRDGSEEYVDIDRPLYSLTNSRDFGILGARQDWSFRLAERAALQWGADVRHLDVDDSFRSVVGPNPDDPALDVAGIYPITTDWRFRQSGWQLGFYVSSRWSVADPLTLELGGRYDEATWTGDGDFSPRTAAALDLGGGRTLRLGWGRYRQFQGIDEVSVLNDDRRYYPSELSEQWTAALEQAWGDGTRLRLEGYLKDGSSLRPIYRNWKNAPDTFPETNEDRILVYPASSRARGIEVYLTRSLGTRLSLRAAYALSIADEVVDRIDNVNFPDPVPFQREHPVPQDQRHAANLDLTWRAGSWTLHGSLALHTGWPATLEELMPVVGEDGQPEQAVRPVEIYGSRLPSYLRLDVRATRRWGRWRLFVEVVNATNHGNVFGYDYFRMRDAAGGIVLARDPEQWFTILPSIGIAWSSGS